MPTYDYLCESCGYRFEKFQSMTANPLDNCPECGGHVRRLISPGNGFLFKGSGFYITDYRSESYKKGKDKEEKTTNTSTSKKDTSKSSTDNKMA